MVQVMARSLRIERSNGVYHVINRGNYRQDLFINDGAHQSFEKCIFQACQKCGWVPMEDLDRLGTQATTPVPPALGLPLD